MSTGFIGGLSQRAAAKLNITVFDCSNTVNVGDLVYASSPDAVGKALATSIATMPAVGFVVEKPSPLRAAVARRGVVGGYLALTQDQPIYVSDTTPGAISLTPPGLVNEVTQVVGVAVSTTEILFDTDISTTITTALDLEKETVPRIETFTVVGSPVPPVPFALTNTPFDPSDTALYVNGVLMQYGVDFTVAGNTVNFNSPLVTLANGDRVNIVYFFLNPGPETAAIPLTTYVNPGVNGQTTFTLTQTPYFPANTNLEVNGVELTYGVGNDYDVAGTTLNYHGPYALVTTDVLAITLFYVP